MPKQTDNSTTDAQSVVPVFLSLLSLGPRNGLPDLRIKLRVCSALLGAEAKQISASRLHPKYTAALKYIPHRLLQTEIQSQRL